MASEPKVLLVGCGGIGGIAAAELARAGGDVTVVTGNPEISRSIATHGVRVRDLDGKEWSQRLSQTAVKAGDLFSHGRYDLCLVATKLTTLKDVLSEVQPLLTPSAPILCMQNGLPESHAASVVGDRSVVGCVVGFGATLLEPGFSQRTSSGGFQLGRLVPRQQDVELDQLAALLGRGIPTKVVDNLQGVRWSKLAINCATSTLGAIGGDTLGHLLSHRFVRRIVLEVWRELCAVADCEGIRLTKVAGTIDIAKLALSDDDKRQSLGSLPLLVKHSILLAIGLKFRRMRSSMAVAIAAVESLCRWVATFRLEESPIKRSLAEFVIAGCLFFWLPHVGAETTSDEDPCRATTLRLGHEWLLAPLLQFHNYHLMHHLFPALPSSRHAAAYRLLADDLHARPLLIQRGFAIRPEPSGEASSCQAEG